MFFLPQTPPLVGLDFSNNHLKVAVLKKRAKKWEAITLQEIPITSLNTFPKGLIPKDAIVVTALSGREVLMRPLELPLKKEKEIASALEFQIEPLLPYGREKCLLQHVKVKTSAHSTSLTVYSAKKDHLQSQIEKLKKNHIDPEIITSAPYALSLLAKSFNHPEETFLFLHLKEDEGVCILIDEKKPVAFHSFSPIIQEIQKTILALASTYKSKKIETISLLDETNSFAKTIEETTGKKVISPFLPDFSLSQETIQKFGYVIALALSGQKEEINFRKEEFAYSQPMKRLKKPFALLICLSCLLTFSFFSFGKLLYKKKLDGLHHQVESLLSALQKKEEVPKQPQEIIKVLENAEKEIAQRPETFPLLPQIPSVSDLLAWISTHPLLVNNDHAPLITIEHFHYSMVSHPDFNHKKDKYQVKVEMEFSAENPNTARAFYELLLAPNPFVDPKKEIKWSGGKGKYELTFFLKDKTRYAA